MDAPDLKSVKLTAQNTFLGTTIAGKYELLEQLGSGGAGTVYKAKHKHLSRMVAIKILHQHLVSSESTLHRFKQEAEAISRLHHPNLVPLYDFGLLDNGTPYMVMELQSGVSLEEYLKKEKRSLSTLIELFIEIAEVLSYAHKQGVVHRDVKPNNIVVLEDANQKPVPKLVDFGLAKVEDASKDLTVSGTAVGTPQYMSPEQCQGMRLDARSDIYSLGCVMYEAFTGQQIIKGDNLFESMTKHLTEYPPPLAQAAPGVSFPSGLDNLVFKAIAKQRDDRYQTADDLAADLRAILAGTGSKIRRGRRRLVAALGSTRTFQIVAATASVAIVACSAAFIWHMQAQTAPADQTVASLDAAAERAITAEHYKEAETLLLSAREKAHPAGRHSKIYRTQLEMLQQLYEVSKQPTKKALIEEELAKVSENLRFGTLESNAQKITELMLAVDQQPDNVAARRKLTALLNDQSVLLCQNDRFTEAKGFLVQALGLEKRSGQQDTQTARTYNNLAVVSYFLGDKQQAESNYKRALSIFKTIPDTDPQLYAKVMRNLADIYRRAGRYKEAQQQLQSALAVYQSGFGPDNHYEAACGNELAGVFLESGEPAKARRQLDMVLQIEEHCKNTRPAELAMTYRYLGKWSAAEGRNQDAESYFRKALQLAEKEFEPQDPALADALFDLATQYQSEAKIDEAAPLFLRAKNIRKQLGTRMHATIFSDG